MAPARAAETHLESLPESLLEPAAESRSLVPHLVLAALLIVLGGVAGASVVANVPRGRITGLDDVRAWFARSEMPVRAWFARSEAPVGSCHAGPAPSEGVH